MTATLAGGLVGLGIEPAAAGINCGFSDPSPQPTEGDTGVTNFDIVVSCGGGVSGTYTTADDTAKAGSDYVATSGTLDFTESPTATIHVPIIGDTVRENLETFTVSFSSESAFSFSAEFTIRDEDGASKVAFFAPEGYSDMLQTDHDMVADLESAGHTVTRITSIDAESIAAGLAGQDALVVANLEGSSGLQDDMSTAAKGAIRDFVAAGRPLAISGTRSMEAPDFLNDVFGFELDNIGFPAADLDSYKDATAAAGTEFANGPDVLREEEHTASVTVASLPANSRAVYVMDPAEYRNDLATTPSGQAGTDAAVALLPYEDGSIAYLGWSWEGSEVEDDGWKALLDSAVELPDLTLADRQVTEGNTSSSTSIVAALSDPVYRNVSADYAMTDAGATGGTDYTAATGNLEIPRTTLTSSVPVTILGDTQDEQDEGLLVTLSNAQGVRIVDGVATLTILDDDETVKQTFDSGYRMVAGDGGIFTFGDRNFHGSTGDLTLQKPIVGGATDTSDYDGYWIVATDGGVFSFNAEFYGSLGGQQLSAPAAEIEPTPTGKGYWIVLADGKVYTFGDAQFFGDMSGKPLNKPVIGMSITPSGKGYWLVAADGGIFNFGDAQFFGSMGDKHLNAPIVDLGPAVDNKGYYLLGRDGGVFTFGSADFKGSTGDLKLNAPVIAILVSPTGSGYWLAASDGGVFTFGAIPFLGSRGGQHLNSPVLDLIN